MNAVIASVRIVVEHVLAGIKRCRIVKDIFRNSKKHFDDLAMEIACGLHNFRNSFRHPVPMISLIEMASNRYSQ